MLHNTYGKPTYHEDDCHLGSRRHLSQRCARLVGSVCFVRICSDRQSPQAGGCWPKEGTRLKNWTGFGPASKDGAEGRDMEI